MKKQQPPIAAFLVWIRKHHCAGPGTPVHCSPRRQRSLSGPSRGTVKPPVRPTGPSPSSWCTSTSYHPSLPCALGVISLQGPSSHPSQPTLQRASLEDVTGGHMAPTQVRHPLQGCAAQCPPSPFLAEQCRPDFGSNPHYRLVSALLHSQEAVKRLIMASSDRPPAKHTHELTASLNPAQGYRNGCTGTDRARAKPSCPQGAPAPAWLPCPSLSPTFSFIFSIFLTELRR